jgi:hypothetical protein
MNWKRLHKDNPVPLGVCVRVEREYHDENLVAVTITDGTAVYRLNIESYNCLTLTSLQPETRKVWRVKGTYGGLPVTQTHLTENAAVTAIDALRKLADANHVTEDVSWSEEEEEVVADGE